MGGKQKGSGLGSHTGGNNDGPDVVVNAPAAASSSTVTNQHILSVPNSVHENLSPASRKMLSVIEVEFAMQVSQATTNAYSRILEELRQASPPTRPPARPE